MHVVGHHKTSNDTPRRAGLYGGTPSPMEWLATPCGRGGSFHHISCCRSAATPPFGNAYKEEMTSDRCEIYHVKRKGKLRWKWRATASDRHTARLDEEYELFYECLSAARNEGFTPTYAGMRMFQKGDPSGFGSPAAGALPRRFNDSLGG